MALSIDGFTVLGRIAARPNAFPSITPEVNKAARDLVIKQLKAKTTDLRQVRAIRDALDEQNFSLLVDTMKDAEVKSLLTKLDKHHPQLKTSHAEWRRRHLRALAGGTAEPNEKPAPKKRAGGPKTKEPRKPTPEEPKRLFSEAMAAIRERK